MMLSQILFFQPFQLYNINKLQGEKWAFLEILRMHQETPAKSVSMAEANTVETAGTVCSLAIILHAGAGR